MTNRRLARPQVLIAAAVLSLAVVVTACGQSGSATQEGAQPPAPQVAKNADGYADISVDQLAAMLDGSEITLVNVHVPYEGDIPGTDVSIDYRQVAENLDKLPGDKNAPIVVYCRSGRMSTEAAQVLVGLGYTNVMELDGGFNAWRQAGYAFEEP